jgi:thiol-disulfide isomerase/thioredoxin
LSPLVRARVRAPELDGAGGWINVAALSLADVRGKVVLLDFWTLACVNCLRAAEELRMLERRFADVLVVIGVHSPKFAHETDHEAVRQAVARHRIEHPVLDDPELRTWDQYGVRAWPTLVIVDAEGRVAGGVSGEGHHDALEQAIEALVAEARDRGTLRPGPLDLDHEALGTGELAFPGKVAADPRGDRLAIADTGHDRVLVTALSGEVLHELGGFYQPQGVRFDADGLLVCETAAGRVWRVSLPGGERELLTDRLASPWDVVRWRGHVVIAEAGRHRLWAIDDDGEPQVIAGTGGENIVDAPALEALLAQPSGLAVTAEGDLAFADAESSALRLLRRDQVVETLAGHGLFEFGDADGDREHARLQHPLGVATGPAGELYVADTFNSLLRVWRGAHLWTVPVEGFDEPGGLDVVADGRVVVADTNNHRIVLVDPVGATGEALDVGRPASSDRIDGGPAAVAETVILEEGAVLTVELDVPLEGDQLDLSGDGGPVQVTATATDPALLPGVTRWRLDTLPARVELELGAGSGRITVELRAATCSGRTCRLRRTQRAYDVILTG